MASNRPLQFPPSIATIQVLCFHGGCYGRVMNLLNSIEKFMASDPCTCSDSTMIDKTSARAYWEEARPVVTRGHSRAVLQNILVPTKICFKQIKKQILPT